METDRSRRNFVPNGLLIRRGMEVVAKLYAIPRQCASKVQQFCADGAIVHYDGAEHEELANVRLSVECEATRFISEDKLVRHDEENPSREIPQSRSGTRMRRVHGKFRCGIEGYSQARAG